MEWKVPLGVAAADPDDGVPDAAGVVVISARWRTRLAYLAMSAFVAWHTAAVRTWDDLLVKDFVVAAAGQSTDTGVFALVLKNLFGARMKIISGYPGGAEISRSIRRASS